MVPPVRGTRGRRQPQKAHQSAEDAEALRRRVRQLEQENALLENHPRPASRRRTCDRVLAEKARELQQQRIARLTRIHKVLSGINSAIVRITDRDALLRAACQIAVENGNLAFATIAARLPDSSFSIVAAMGSEEVQAPLLGTARGNVEDGLELLRRVDGRRAPVLVNDTRSARELGLGQQFAAAGHEAIAAFPLAPSGELEYVFVLSELHVCAESRAQGVRYRLLLPRMLSKLSVRKAMATKVECGRRASVPAATPKPLSTSAWFALVSMLTTAFDVHAQEPPPPAAPPNVDTPATAAPVGPTTGGGARPPATSSVAQPPPPAYAPQYGYSHPPPYAASPPPSQDQPRPARAGFQMYLQTGLRIPFGDASDAPGDSLAARYSWQWAFDVGLGAKVTEDFYLGAYLGFSLGFEGDDTHIEALCNDDDDNLENDISCSSATARIGLEGIYSFSPGERWNPWLGYGFGGELASQSIHDRQLGHKESATSTGYTWAKLSFGADYRRAVGVTPFGELAFGRFNNTDTKVDGDSMRIAIPDRALHCWLFLGLRLVILP